MKDKIKYKFDLFINSINNLKTNLLFWICLSLTLVYFSSGYCKWIEIGVCVLSVIALTILPLQSSMCLFTFLHSFTLSNIGYNSCFIATFGVYCLILLVKYCIGLKQGKFKFYKKIVIILASFLLVSIIISLFGPLYGGSWMYIAYAVLFYCVFAMRKEFTVSQILNYMFGGILVSCSLAFVSMLLPKFQYNVWYSGNRFMGFFNNPNTLYIRALFVLAYYMYRYLNDKLSTLSFGTIYVLCSGLAVLTQSKAGLLSLAILTILFIILFLKKDFKKNIKILGIFALFLAVFVAVGFKLIVQIVERLTDSFGTKNFLHAFLTGRDEIWLLYLKAIFKNPFYALFGHGVLTRQVFVASQFGFTEAHSLYIFLLHRFGIVGTSFLCYIIYLFIKELNYKKAKFNGFLPLIYILIVSLIANTMKYNNICYFLFAIMIIFQNHRKEEQIETNNDCLDITTNT